MEVLIHFVSTVFELLYLAIIARILLSWFRTSRSGKFYQIVYGITEPIMAPARRIIPTIGMLDFSPIVVLILIDILQGVVVRFLMNL
jgi:YggT family protein